MATYLALIWCIAALGLAYFPIPSQRRFMHAYSFPLALLAVWAINKLEKIFVHNNETGWQRRLWNYALISWLIMISIGTAYISFGSSLVLFQQKSNYYDPVSLIAGVDWLNINGNPDEVVFASEQTSYLIAERTRLRTYSGHWAETLYFDKKQQFIENALKGGIELQLFLDKNIQWVVVGPYEQALGNGDLKITETFQLRYKRDNVKIYRVVP